MAPARVERTTLKPRSPLASGPAALLELRRRLSSMGVQMKYTSADKAADEHLYLRLLRSSLCAPAGGVLQTARGCGRVAAPDLGQPGSAGWSAWSVPPGAYLGGSLGGQWWPLPRRRLSVTLGLERCHSVLWSGRCAGSPGPQLRSFLTSVEGCVLLSPCGACLCDAVL
jgi:hypothetical protein